MSDQRTNRPDRRQSQRRTPKRRGHGAFLRVGILLVALVVTVTLLGSLVRVLGGGAAAAEASPTPAPTAVPTPVPTPSPEPTPALPDVDVMAWNLRLVRYENPLGEDFAPENLTEIENNQWMDGRVADSMKALIAAARAEGYTVYVCSGYRDYNTQSVIYWNHIYNYTAQGMTEEEAHAATRLAVNYPGCSEHQYGLTADILESASQDMEPYIGGSGLMLWLEQHCADYGFVIRYPDGKTPITGVEYEPWHLRYVGGAAARYMMENNLCLEEFLALYDAPSVG